ncbi:AraC family transcriptional regulator [Algoriphagus yeomjeoni]|uniref:AraC-like DNA-binding protein n=1 Tax=Algoriphagus yeomjeoni TaxID=291403 RepID=A0A327PCF3_9BACT|nr:AraC family transcriptional regulator [Algoriphagus yeomjeoni]RAI89918.1 AraC-like DNA-binding protein [Algoriphagus yeomjeoni]
MPHCPFKYHHETLAEVDRFPHIVEFGLRNNNSVTLDSFEVRKANYLQLYYIVDGKFDWIINGKNETLYPGDSALILPGQEIGGAHGYFGIGTLYWIYLKVEKIDSEGCLVLGKWSRIKKSEWQIIGKILESNQKPVMRAGEFSSMFQVMQSEIENSEIGSFTRVNYILDSVLILLCRQVTRQAVSRRDFPKSFTNLEESLRKDLSHKWTVEEMAALMGLGTTTFTEKVKNYTGFPPLNYLINIRISEAIRLLKLKDINITDIALETGFYSSQHFSTTFKKLTGHTPKEYRKRYTSN